MPSSCRPALFYETFYNIGSGAFVALFGLALATLKSEVFTPGGTKEHLMFVAASPLFRTVLGWRYCAGLFRICLCQDSRAAASVVPVR